MILSDAITRVADDSNVNSSISSVSARLIREVNRICQQEWDGFRWSWRWRNYRIVTDTDYSTGTVTATNGSRTITGAGTTFLSSHVTWHVNFTGDSVQNWYKVRKFTSATQLELDVPYQGTTGSGKSYVLRHFDYVLPTEIWDLANPIVTNQNKPIPILEPSSIDIVGPVPFYKGYPLAVSIYSSDIMPTTYSTGTVTGTINTVTLTGSGTAWLANIYPGDQVVIGSTTYSVYSVDSDTQITLYNQQQATSTGATYTITRQLGRVLRIMWPSTDNYTIDIRALRKYMPLVNNNDTNELLYRCGHAIVNRVAALELKSQNDVRSKLLMEESTVDMARAKAEDDADTPRDAVQPIFSYRSNRRNLYRGSIR